MEQNKKCTLKENKIVKVTKKRNNRENNEKRGAKT